MSENIISNYFQTCQRLCINNCLNKNLWVVQRQKKDNSGTLQQVLSLISRGMFSKKKKVSNHSSLLKVGMSIVFMLYILRSKQDSSFKLKCSVFKNVGWLDL